MFCDEYIQNLLLQPGMVVMPITQDGGHELETALR